MGLFFISFALVFTSSYLFTSILSKKKSLLGFIYLFLIAFAQIILTFEILSLFNAIKPFWVLTFNLLLTITSIYIWIKKSKPLWTLDLASFKNRLINSFKLDKSLAALFIGFCTLIISAVILCIIMPISSMDGIGYHATRSLIWVANGNLNHFDIADIRALCLPINSEILYSWVLLFTKKDVFLGFFAFFGYLLSIFSIYNILGLIGLSTRKKLWTIFILSSFSSVIVQISGTETDIIIAGLITTSIFLFWHSLKYNEKTPLIMSALAYAIAIGTKTTAIIAIPGVGLFLLALSIHFNKKEFYKPILSFIGYGIISFLIFSSYNYILNYFHFKNILGSQSIIEATKNYYGLKAIPANLIRYTFLFFDFTGFRWTDYVGQDILLVRDSILNAFDLLQIPEGIYSRRTIPNRTLLDPLMGAGVLGFLVFLPCLIWSIVKPLFKSKSKKTWLLFSFGSLFILNMIIMSYLLAFMIFSVRFIMCFMVISAPILAYSYCKRGNPIKYIIIAFSLFYLIFVSTHLWARPVCKIIPHLIKNPSLTKFRRDFKCSAFNVGVDFKSDTCLLTNKIKKEYTTDNRILGFFNEDDSVYLIKELYFQGYKIDFALLEDADKIDYGKYNIVIMPSTGQKSTYIKDYEKRKDEIELINGKMVIIKEKPVMCLYVKNPNTINSKNAGERKPYQVLCGMSENFSVTKDLQPFDIAGKYERNNPKRPYYIILRNTKLPLYLKK